MVYARAGQDVEGCATVNERCERRERGFRLNRKGQPDYLERGRAHAVHQSLFERPVGRAGADARSWGEGAKIGAVAMKTVLIVEDHHDCAEPLARMLGHCGYRALVAEGGRQAIGFMNTIVPDLVLLDVMLPGMNGVEFLQAVRIHRLFAELPVVAYTAMSDVETHRRLIELGVRRVLQKGTDSFGDVLESVKLAIGEPRDEGDQSREGSPPTAA